ncbi:hypothetical protein AYO42_03295 [Rhizomicrobium sp. SCGC AG-212-E05]|nr:hypothetical protein AYO42_03295 [Rhizomicrobium sp. SCGC AG-212-E05]
MARVPVVATIRDAYVFTAANLGGIIGLIWIPMVLVTVMGFFTFQRYYNAVIEAMASGATATLGPTMLMMLGYIVAALLLHAVMYVAVVQLALGTRSAPPWAHFAFGAEEWRMFRAFLAFLGLLLAFVIPILVIGTAATGGGGTPGPAMAGLVLLIYGVLILAVPRFLALLPALAVAENVPVLRRSWQLSAGNFWRLLGILAGIFVPALFVMGLLQVVLGGRLPAATSGTDQMQMMAGLLRARDTLPIVSGLGFFISPVLIGLFSHASVSAWRALKTEPTVDIQA